MNYVCLESEKAMTDKASFSNYAGSAFAAIGGLITMELLFLALGLIVGIAGLWVKAYYAHKDDLRKEAEELRKQERHAIYVNGHHHDK